MRKSISLADAAGMIGDGASLVIGGFMGVGSPYRMIAELVRQGRTRLIVPANVPDMVVGG